MINGLKKENRKLRNELIVTQKEIDIISVQLGDGQRTIIMQWSMYGGGVLGSSLSLDLVLPHLVPSRKRRDRQMNQIAFFVALSYYQELCIWRRDDGVKIYLVGGAVRDALLGLPVKNRDQVVVGSAPQEVLNAGYQQVGRDFPVFLRPQTHEEYTLVCTERKSGFGCTSLTYHAAPDIALEDDLKCCDLTINALAQDDNGEVIDPYNGLDDLQNRLLRHVSPAFGEGPLRVLCVARFAARYAHLCSRTAGETLVLMCEMTHAGELEHLIPGRVWKEMENTLTTHNPQVFSQILRDCDALRILFPKINTLFGAPTPARQHPKIDTGIRTSVTLSMTAMLSPRINVRFAALCHDLGKGLTPPEL